MYFPPSSLAQGAQLVVLLLVAHMHGGGGEGIDISGSAGAHTLEFPLVFWAKVWGWGEGGKVAVLLVLVVVVLMLEVSEGIWFTAHGRGNGHKSGIDEPCTVETKCRANWPPQETVTKLRMVGTGGGIGVGRLGAREGAVAHFYTVHKIKHLALVPLASIVQYHGHECRHSEQAKNEACATGMRIVRPQGGPMAAAAIMVLVLVAVSEIHECWR
ncbi:hypothetical protein BJV74DRAFT_799016 [Russula compacta]|nr:hypothetical protein BJV74DRAFT_799016 [Russula compacta]